MSVHRGRCPECRREFVYVLNRRHRVEPEHCGRLACRARHDWQAADWQGLARMARARRRAGVPLNDLDQLALEREGRCDDARS